MIKICNCKKCGNEWVTRQEMPKQCPKCCSRLWDREPMITDSYNHSCSRCGESWLGKVENPKACPNCKSQLWDKDKLEKTSHTCCRCKWEWKGKADAIRCPGCQSLRWRQERNMHSHMCQKCFHEWKSGVEVPYKCPRCQTQMRIKQKSEKYKYVNGRRVGTRCICSAWYPLVVGRTRYRCPNCKSGAGGTVEIEKQEIGDEENWGPL